MKDPKSLRYEDFITHGYYTISNCGGYEIQLSDCGTMARVATITDRVLEISDWLEIDYVFNNDTGEYESVIDPEGYDIPLNMVMKIKRFQEA